MYGFGATATVLDDAIAALPSCYSQELSNCLDHGNAAGLPKAQCDAIEAAYSADQATASAMDQAVNALSVCKPSMVPYLGLAFAAGVLVTLMVRR